MIFSETPLFGSYVIEPELRRDSRGWFTRYFCLNDFQQIGHKGDWVQLNHSFTVKKGSIRGMHYQLPPFAEIKLVKCVSGAIIDIIVDIRENSPTFLKSFMLEISAENKKMIYIPEGFAHGFQTLTDNCELIYHHTAFYKPDVESGLRFDDPLLNIEWLLPIGEISNRDLSYKHISKDFKGVKQQL